MVADLNKEKAAPTADAMASSCVSRETSVRRSRGDLKRR